MLYVFKLIPISKMYCLKPIDFVNRKPPGRKPSSRFFVGQTSDESGTQGLPAIITVCVKIDAHFWILVSQTDFKRTICFISFYKLQREGSDRGKLSTYLPTAAIGG